MASPYFIPSYASLDRPRPSECETTGEHQGDSYEQTDIDGQAWERWTCCDDETLLED